MKIKLHIILFLEFDSLLSKMPVGEITEPIRTPGGFIILKLNAKRGGQSVVVDEVHVRHILIKPSEIRTEAQTEALINKIHDRIEAGEMRVDELIEEYSRIPNALEPSRALAPFLLTKALWAARSGNIPLAEATLAQAKATVGDTERDPFLHLQVIQLQGEIALCDEGREEKALSFFEAAIERAIDQRLPFDRARLLTKRGRALERLGCLADARASYRESVELATSLGLSGGVLDEPADALTRIGDA